MLTMLVTGLKENQPVATVSFWERIWYPGLAKDNQWQLQLVGFCNADYVGYYEAQGLMDYFNMLNGPTYDILVRHFWVRAHVCDKKAAKLEET